MRRLGLVIGSFAFATTMLLGQLQTAAAQENRRNQNSDAQRKEQNRSDQQNQSGTFYRNQNRNDQQNQSGTYDRNQQQSQYGNRQESPTFVTVRVPSQDAQIWFDDYRTQQRGMERRYQSPPLEAGRYSYQVRIKWRENGQEMTRTRTVNVRPGQMVMVDFGQGGAGQLTGEGSEDQEQQPNVNRPTEQRRNQSQPRQQQQQRQQKNNNPPPSQPD
jgi:uncharacterized protein (TIGR03000 family)